MTMRFKSIGCLLVVLTVTNSAGLNADESKAKFVSMFDGKTLDGWTVMPAKAKAAWSVDNGMIIGEGDKGRSYLSFDRGDIADFEMTFDYRFPGEGNSGVNLRAIRDETGKRDFKAYHADIGHVGIGKQVLGAWDFHTPGRKEHACFRGDRLVIDKDDKPTVTPIKDGLKLADIRAKDWNHVRIVVKDNNFKLFINKELSSEFTEQLPKERRLHRGMIQLQLHDPGMIVHFRDLNIMVLK